MGAHSGNQRGLRDASELYKDGQQAHDGFLWLAGGLIVGYLVQKTRVASLTIGGIDYTSAFIEFQVSDSSANRQGFVSTTGTLKLGQRPGGTEVEDYSRAKFKRGVPVILDIQTEGGAAVRHPRGYLYVISTGYDIESEQLEIELGCRITLARIIDDASTILPLVPIPLDEAQRTVANCAASFQSAGLCLYQDNQGNLQTRNFFSGDSYSTTAAGQWTSVLGETALSASPLALSGAIPDEIKLSWNVPEALEGASSDTTDTSTTTNYYFLSYPATTYVRALGEACYTSTEAGGYTGFYRDPVRVLADSNVSDLTVLPTIDGVALSESDRVLLVSQNNKKDNGIWIAKLGGWERPAKSRISPGTWVEVAQGDTFAGQYWEMTTENWYLFNGQSEQEWEQFDNESITAIACSDDVETSSNEVSNGGCGNNIDAPRGITTTIGGAYFTDQPISCNTTWTAQAAPTYISVVSQETSTSYYDAPGGQISRTRVERYGPLVEVQSQFYADRYATCAARYASICDPGGGCEFTGTGMFLVGYTETNYSYAPGSNELVEQTVSEYKSLFELAQTEDWRAGVLDGVPYQFNESFDTQYKDQFILYSFTRTRYSEEGGRNIEITESYVSNSSRGVGLKEIQSALRGIKTVSKRVSRTKSSLADRPDSVNSISTSTTSKSGTIRLVDGKYITPPAEAGPYIAEESIPLPLLFNTQAEIDAIVDSYSFYIQKFSKGDSYGVSIAEALRPEIVTNWVPGMPFRYSDPANGKVLALRMDACTWGVSRDEAIVATNGIWIGDSNGTVTVGSNLVGDSQPDMTATQGRLHGVGGSGTPTPPTNSTPPAPPSVDGETTVEAGAIAFEVDVFIDASTSLFTYTEDGVLPIVEEEYQSTVHPTFLVNVIGAVYTAGSLLETTASGGIPLEYGGSLVTDTGTLVDEDLFA